MSNHFDLLASTWDQDPMKIERSRITAEYCKKVPLKVSKHLLDFGGGTGLLSLYLHDSFDEITIGDTSKEMLRVAQEKIRESNISNIRTFELKGDISEFIDRKEKFSAIITLMTLHHVADIDGFLSSASKIIDDNGALIVADLYSEDGSFHNDFEDYEGHNGFEIEELSQKLDRAGFKVSQVCRYFEIKKEISQGEERLFPLFFLVAEKLESKT